MKREEALERIDDYIDGLLNAREREAFEACMADDGAVRTEMEAIMELKRQSSALPASLMPERDLWPDIKARIDRPTAGIDFSTPRGRQPRYSIMRYVMAAAALVLMFVGVRAMIEFDGGVQQQPAPVVTQDPELNPIAQEYAAAMEELLGALRDRQPSMDEEALETLAIVEENLAIIEGAIDNISLALADNPDSAELERMLHAAYQSEVNLLRQAVQLADES